MNCPKCGTTQGLNDSGRCMACDYSPMQEARLARDRMENQSEQFRHIAATLDRIEALLARRHKRKKNK